LGAAPPQDARSVAQSLAAQLERSAFVPDLAMHTARAWLEAGEPGVARHFAQLVVDDPSASDRLRILALRMLDTTPTVHETGPPPTEPFQQAGVIVVSEEGDRNGPPGAPRPPWVEVPEPPPEVFRPFAPEFVAAVSNPHGEQRGSRSEPRSLDSIGASAPRTALMIRTAKTRPQSEDTPLQKLGVLDPRLVLLMEPDSPRAASYRLLRDRLLANKMPRIIAVSSSAAHEGKTTCAINLALALCEKPSTRVLLMEGNFYEPSLGAIFHIDALTRSDPERPFPSLLPYRIAEITRSLHVAALVRRVGEPSPPFNSRWFDMVIYHLSSADYDHIVIDAAALDGSPSVTHLLSVADGTLLTVRSHATTARGLRRAAEQIPAGRALGVTLIDSDT
jgi:Mrp family chromosome partitioning ATPase